MNKNPALWAEVCMSYPSFSHFMFVVKVSIPVQRLIKLISSPKTHKTTVPTGNDFLRTPWKALEKCFPLIGYSGKAKSIFSRQTFCR